MRKYVECPTIRWELDHIQCDRCKRIDTDTMQIQEYFTFNQDVGYAGVLGDGNRVRLDLCQYCFKEMFEGVYRIEGNYILGTDSES